MPVETINDEERMNRAVLSLRAFIRDKKALNKLLAGQYESSDEELKMCLQMALEDWNTTPPEIGNVTLGRHPAKFLLITKAALLALTSAGVWHSREHMPSSDGGTSADDHAKAGEYSGWLDRLSNDYERKKSDLKTARNISAALNGMGLASEYAAVGQNMLNIYGYTW